MRYSLLPALIAALASASPLGAQTFSLRLPSATDGGLTRAVELPDGRLVALAYESLSSSYLVFLDSAGQPLGRVELSAWGSDLAAHSNGTLALAGWGSFGFGWQAMLDGQGSTFWSVLHQEVLGVVVESSLQAVGELANGDLLFTGWTAEDDCDRELLLTRVTPAGVPLWSFRLGSASAYFVGNHAVELANGDLVAVGVTTFGRPLAVGVSASGSLLWKRSFVRSGAFDPRSRVAATDDGGLVFVQGAWASSPDGRVHKLDGAGQVQWERSYGGGVLDRVADVVATPGGGCVLAGHTGSFGARGTDLRLVALDGTGGILWQRRYGSPAEERAASLTRLPSGDLLLAGQQRVGGLWQALLLRLDGAGLLTGCPPGVTWASPVEHATGTEEPAGPVANPSLQVQSGPQATPTGPPAVQFACLSMVLGQPVCGPATPNSSGLPARLSAWGSSALADNHLVLTAADLPAHQFGYFLAGMGSGQSTPPLVQGPLCLNGATIHRLLASAASSGAAGALGYEVDLTGIPGHGAVLAGQTWNFQAWFRDQNPTATSNFTDALGVAY